MYGIDKQSAAITVQHMNTSGEITPHLTADKYKLLFDLEVLNEHQPCVLQLGFVNY